MNTKHAYLIIANDKYSQLSFLLALLDNARNDFYILIDAKSSFSDSDKSILQEAVTNSGIYFVERLPIFWGDFSLVKAELRLFSEALHNNTKYVYYHLLSGVDLPIVPVKDILTFFDEHPNKIFLTNACMDNSIYNRVKYAYYWTRYNRKSGYSNIVTIPFRIMNKVSLSLQKMTRVNHFKDSNVELGYGSQWVSLDNSTVQLINDNIDWITRTFQYSYLCDELFIPTLLNKYPSFKRKVYHSQPVTDRPDEFQGNLRYINWWDGSPYTWQDGDEKQIQRGVELGHLFSRKFDIEKSPKLKNYLIHLAKKDERIN